MIETGKLVLLLNAGFLAQTYSTWVIIFPIFNSKCLTANLKYSAIYED